VSHQPERPEPEKLAEAGRRAGSTGTLIFVPTYNEQGTIARMIDALLALPISADVLVVDDRSTDGTTEWLTSRAARESRLSLIVRPGKLGVGSAHKLGWLYARRFGYRQIATLDADFSHDPADVVRLIAALERGADVAIGSRFAPGGKLDYRGWRLFLSYSANYLARAALRLPIAEYTTSLRAARLDRVPAGLVESIENDGYGFFLICAVRLVRAGLAVSEVPIHFRDRHEGISKIPRLEILRGAFNLARLAVGHRRVSSGPLPGEAARDCPVCGQPYCIPEPTGEGHCLACGARSGRTGACVAQDSAGV
jgi:dolichol-phosphate mannosyltransferase